MLQTLTQSVIQYTFNNASIASFNLQSMNTHIYNLHRDKQLNS